MTKGRPPGSASLTPWSVNPPRRPPEVRAPTASSPSRRGLRAGEHRTEEEALAGPRPREEEHAEDGRGEEHAENDRSGQAEAAAGDPHR